MIFLQLHASDMRVSNVVVQASAIEPAHLPESLETR